MKKHSPNFHTNLEEADNAKNNRAATFFWTVVTISLFLLGFSLTGCTHKQDKKIVKMADGRFYQLEQAVADETYRLRLIDTSEINELYK
jgi:hypothetical protein